MKQSRRPWGEGSYDYIESKKSYRWRGYYKDPISGKNHRKEITANNKKSLRLKVKQWQEQVAAGQAHRIKVSDWCQIWLNTAKATTRPATARRYGVTARCHILPQWGNLYLDEVNSISIQNYLNSLADTHTYKGIKTIRAHILACLNLSVKYDLLKKNPAINTKIAKKKYIRPIRKLAIL